MTDTPGPDDYAFPIAPGDVPYWQPGMTLRDWFAGQAMPALLETCGYDTREKGENYADYIARKSYEIADAMMAERAKGDDT
jgi:hypothetical protein